MKTLKENLKTIEAYAGADTANAEGFSAWTPSDATLLGQLAMTGTLGNSFYANAKTIRGLGRSIKTAISGWIKKNTTTYYAQKYRKQIADAIRLSRFKGEDSIYAYILDAYSDVKGNSAEKQERAYAEYPDLAAHRDFVRAMFVGFFMKGLKDVTVLPWDTRVEPYGVVASEPVMKHIGAITGMVGGGTYMEAGVKHMLRNGMETDYAVFLTDTEEYGSGWLSAWKQYHKRYPKAVAFVLRGDSYRTSPIDEKLAEELNVYQVFGWNDSVIDYMKFVIGSRKEAA